MADEKDCAELDQIRHHHHQVDRWKHYRRQMQVLHKQLAVVLHKVRNAKPPSVADLTHTSDVPVSFEAVCISLVIDYLRYDETNTRQLLSYIVSIETALGSRYMRVNIPRNLLFRKMVAFCEIPYHMSLRVQTSPHTFIFECVKYRISIVCDDLMSLDDPDLDGAADETAGFMSDAIIIDGFDGDANALSILLDTEHDISVHLDVSTGERSYRLWNVSDIRFDPISTEAEVDLPNRVAQLSACGRIPGVCPFHRDNPGVLESWYQRIPMNELYAEPRPSACVFRKWAGTKRKTLLPRRSARLEDKAKCSATGEEQEEDRDVDHQREIDSEATSRIRPKRTKRW